MAANLPMETERLIIRPWRDSDRADYLATCNNEAVTAHLGGPSTVEDIDAGLARIAESQQENGFCYWAVERTADGAFIGYCGLKHTNLADSPVEGEIEIGWRLRDDLWGQGYASEAQRQCSTGHGHTSASTASYPSRCPPIGEAGRHGADRHDQVPGTGLCPSGFRAGSSAQRTHHLCDGAALKPQALLDRGDPFCLAPVQ